MDLKLCINIHAVCNRKWYFLVGEKIKSLKALDQKEKQ